MLCYKENFKLALTEILLLVHLFPEAKLKCTLLRPTYFNKQPFPAGEILLQFSVIYHRKNINT